MTNKKRLSPVEWGKKYRKGKGYAGESGKLGGAIGPVYPYPTDKLKAYTPTPEQKAAMDKMKKAAFKKKK